MKVLFCGLGSIGQRHLRNLRMLMGNKVKVLAFRQKGTCPLLKEDMTADPENSVEKKYGVQSFWNLDEALAEKVDVVFITSPNVYHIPLAIKAARKGCHLFIEKPLSHSMEGVMELKEIVEAQNLKVFIAYQFRFHPGLKWIKQMIDQGKLGQLIGAHIVNAEYLPDWHPYEAYQNSSYGKKSLGGGSLNLQTHELDYALWFFGLPESLYCVGGHLSQLDIDVEDAMSLLLKGSYRNLPFPIHIRLDCLQRPPKRLCEVVGEAGKMAYDYYQNRVVWTPLDNSKTEVREFTDFHRNQMYLDELKHFLNCLQDKETPRVDLDEGIRSLKIGMAAFQSLNRNQVVSLQEVATLVS